MSAPQAPELLTVTPPTFDILQELQVILGVEDHPSPARALEVTLIWYDDMTTAGNVLRFVPPANQKAWRDYARPLEIDPTPSPHADGGYTMLVEGEAQRRLAMSDDLVQLATMRGLEQMVRLKAEVAFRRADDWAIEVDTDGGTTQ